MTQQSFFNPPELGVLYALTQLEGEQRCNALDITDSHYRTLENANNWIEKVITDLHTCYTSGHPAFDTYGQQAYDKLFEIWSIMTCEGIEHYPYPATVSHYVPPVSDEQKMRAHLEGLTEDLYSGDVTAHNALHNLCQSYNLVSNEGAVTNYIKMLYNGYNGGFYCVAAQDHKNGIDLMGRMIFEFVAGQTGSSGRGVDVFSQPFARLSDLEKWKRLEHKLNLQFNGSDPVRFMGFNEIFQLQDPMRRLVVINLFDDPFPEMSITQVTNLILKVSPNTTVFFLVNQPVDFNGPILFV